MYLLVGLGNPGNEYANTRHNAGFWVVNYLSKRTGIKLDQARLKSRLGEGSFRQEKIILARPRTYMNLSGEAVSSLVGGFNLPLSRLLVIYDDLYLDLGQIRIRPKGSGGGHKGIASIINALGSSEFARLRIGIGPLKEGFALTDYVLGKFEDEEEEKLEEVIKRASLAALDVILKGLEFAMNKYN
ncbi:aminoacyl-tRNA hydrolase [bacterium]|nr:aminoacyl-tRNA hydrolase [bacterium]MBU1614137.1 aminoacyl-tRNA hydrolase [bacterium]